MQENWQVLLKDSIIKQYVQNPQKEWVDLNISTSGLLNLTIVSDRFVGLSMPQRKEQISRLLQFKREIQEHLKPDILLVDSINGINQWGALSLIQAADEAMIFLFPNEQNKQGIEVLLQSLQNLNNLSINFVFSPVPDMTEFGLSKVKETWKSLRKKIKIATNENYEEDENESDLDNAQSPIEEFLVVPYLVPIALADSYPVQGTQDYYTKIANLIDEKTDELKRSNVLNTMGL